VQSMIVDSRPIEQSPPSKTIEISEPRSLTTCRAVVGLTLPNLLQMEQRLRHLISSKVLS